MSKEYKYKCLKCGHLFIGIEGSICPNCGHKELRKILFWELIKYLTGKK